MDSKTAKDCTLYLKEVLKTTETQIKGLQDLRNNLSKTIQNLDLHNRITDVPMCKHITFNKSTGYYFAENLFKPICTDEFELNHPKEFRELMICKECKKK